MARCDPAYGQILVGAAKVKITFSGFLFCLAALVRVTCATLCILEGILPLARPGPCLVGAFPGSIRPIPQALGLAASHPGRAQALGTGAGNGASGEVPGPVGGGAGPGRGVCRAWVGAGWPSARVGVEAGRGPGRRPMGMGEEWVGSWALNPLVAYMMGFLLFPRGFIIRGPVPMVPVYDSAVCPRYLFY